jgi:hypothetical protein
MMSVMDVTFRYLGPDEGTVLTTAIEAAYGQSYDVRWVYDPAEVGPGSKREPTFPASPKAPQASCFVTSG